MRPRKRVLVVVDDEVARDRLGYLLHLRHYRPELAATGTEALEMLRGWQSQYTSRVDSVDVLLVGVALPGRDALMRAAHLMHPELPQALVSVGRKPTSVLRLMELISTMTGRRRGPKRKVAA